MNKELEQIQKIVFAYFKDVDDKTTMDITHSFVFTNPTKNDKVSKLFMKFLKDNGLELTYVNYLSDLQDPNKMFLRSSLTEAHMIEQIKIAFLVMSFNRNFNLNKEEQKEESQLKKNFKFVKKKCFEILNYLNNNEIYIYSKEEDGELIKKIQKMK